MDMTVEKAKEIVLKETGKNKKELYTCCDYGDFYTFVFSDGASCSYKINKETGKCEKLSMYDAIKEKLVLKIKKLYTIINGEIMEV